MMQLQQTYIRTTRRTLRGKRSVKSTTQQQNKLRCSSIGFSSLKTNLVIGSATILWSALSVGLFVYNVCHNGPHTLLPRSLTKLRPMWRRLHARFSPKKRTFFSKLKKTLKLLIVMIMNWNNLKQGRKMVILRGWGRYIYNRKDDIMHGISPWRSQFKSLLWDSLISYYKHAPKLAINKNNNPLQQIQ